MCYQGYKNQNSIFNSLNQVRKRYLRTISPFKQTKVFIVARIVDVLCSSKKIRYLYHHQRCILIVSNKQEQHLHSLIWAILLPSR